MKSFKSKLLLLHFFLCAAPAFALNDVYLIPPVQLLPLQKMETNDYGIVIADKNDVLNENVWKNTSFYSVNAKFSDIQNQLPAEAEKIRLHLLKLAAKAPQGTTDQSFITLKLNSLFNRGQFDDAYALMQKIPEKKRTDDQNNIYTNVLLMQNMQTACFLTDQKNDNLLRQELAAVCAAFNQNEDDAFLALDVLKEQGEADPFIIEAIDKFLSQKPLKTPPEKITPLTAAVWRQGQNKLIQPDKNSELWYKMMFVLDETIPVEKRLATAEKLVQHGSLAPSKLRTYYQQVSFNEYKNKPLPNEIKRARFVQKAAELSSLPNDNLKKQDFIKQGIVSAKEDRISYAFSAAIKDVLKTLAPDIDTLAKSAEFIEAFSLAGLKEQALDWYKKAVILYPVSETTAYGWYFAELAEQNKTRHVFIPALENMMAYVEKKQTADEKFTAKIDRLMLVFKTLRMLQPDETWNYTSFAEDSDEDKFIKQGFVNLKDRPVGDTVLAALREINGTYIGLLNALSLLTEVGLEREAAAITAQSMDLILNPV